MRMAFKKVTSDQTGSGIAIEIESTVMVTARHTDSPQIASEAATAWISRNEATGAAPPSKPTVPRDPIMAEFPGTRGRITRNISRIVQPSLAILRRAPPRKRQNS
jgi:hypothetical protein